MPRYFAIDPTDTYLLAANMDTDEIVSFNVNSRTGMLSSTGYRLRIPTPTCIKILTNNS